MNTGLIVTLFLSFLFVLINNTLALMAGIYIASDLGGNQYDSLYPTVFFVIGNALTVPLGKVLANHYGCRKSLTACLSLIALTSLVCSSAPNFQIFTLGRLFEGLVSGPIYVLITRSLPKKEYVPPINLTVFIIAPIIGAVTGGVVAYEYNWRWVFLANFPASLLLALPIWTLLKDSLPKSYPPFDWIGFFFYFTGLLSLCFALTLGQELDWFRSSLITTAIIVGLVCLPFSIIRGCLHPHPFLNFRMLKHPAFAFGYFNLAAFFSAYFGMIVLLSLWLTLDAKYSPWWIGVLLACMILVAFLPAALIHRKMLCDCRFVLIAAIIFLAWSCFRTETFNVQLNFGRIVSSRILAGIGIAFFVPAVFRLCFRTYMAKRTENVVELFQIARTIASGLGAALYSTLWQRRLAFYHDRLGSNITAFSEKTQQFYSKAAEFYIQGGAANEQLEYFLERESTSLALDDCFYFMGWFMVGLLILSLFTFFLERDLFFPEKKAARA